MKILAILKKELQTYFYSPVAYIVFSAFLLLIGYLFCMVLFNSRFATLEPLFFNVGFVVMLATPILTMRLISEERRSNTLELLLTSPISPVEVVLGKFLACYVLYVVLLVLTLQYPYTMMAHAPAMDTGPIVAGYVGLLLLGAAFISFGLFASSLSENQIISAMISFGGLLMFWIVGWVKVAMADYKFGEVLAQLSLLERFQQFVRGVIDSGNVIFFLAFTVVWLFVTTRVIESQRWR